MNTFDLKETTDQKQWDSFLLAENPWSLFQSYLWGEVQIRCGFEVTRWLLYKNTQIVAQAQTILIRAKKGTFLHVRQGPVIKKVDNEAEIWHKLTQYLRKIALAKSACYIRLSPLIEDSEVNRGYIKQLGAIPAPIHRMDAEVSWVLDLDKDEETLLGQMRKTTRYLIKHAQKMGVVVRESTEIQEFLDLYKATYKRHRFVPYGGITEEFEVFGKHKQALLLVATHQGRALASALILFWGNQAIYHHGASIPTKIPASYLLQWHAIKLAKKRGAALYNFWGIAPQNSPDHPWRGITLFKQGFGGREVSFMHAHDIPLSLFYAISYTIEFARKLSRGY